jgi:hypothetical protein
MVWSFLVAYDLIGVFPLISTLRWTILSGQLLLPFNVAGVALILFGPRAFLDPLRYVLLFVLAILTLGVAYRSQEIIIAGFLITFYTLSVLGHVGRPHAIATAITFAASVIAIAAIDVGLLLASTGRIFEIGGSRVDVLISSVFGKQVGDIGRLLEMQFALAKFLESCRRKGPRLPGATELDLSWKRTRACALGSRAWQKYSYVFYLHNIVANVAMTMGLVGLAALALIAIDSTLSFRRGWQQPARFSAFAGIDRVGGLLAGRGAVYPATVQSLDRRACRHSRSRGRNGIATSAFVAMPAKTNERTSHRGPDGQNQI